MRKIIVIVVDDDLTCNECDCSMVWNRDEHEIEIQVRRGYEEDIESYTHEFSEIAICDCVDLESDDDVWIADIMLEMSWDDDKWNQIFVMENE